MNEPIIGSIYDCKSENGTHRYQVLSISDGKVFLRSTTDTTEGWVHLDNWMATPDRQTLVVETKNAALSWRAGEETPERPEHDGYLDLGVDSIGHHYTRPAFSRELAYAHFDKLESLVSSLRSQLEAKDAELAVVDEALARRPAVADAPNRYIAICRGFDSASKNASRAATSDHWEMHYKIQVARAEKAEAALSTAERDAIKKALEAVKGERPIQYEEFLSDPTDDNFGGFCRAIQLSESAILALLQKESVS